MNNWRQKTYHCVNPIRSGVGGFKSPPPPQISCIHAFNFGATLLCVGDFSQTTPYGEKKLLIGGHDLAVRGSQNIKLT